MRAISEFDGLTAPAFRDEILPAGQPAVLRGLLREWPLVRAGRQSREAFCRYLKGFDRDHDLDTMVAPPSIRGRLFYNEDLSGLNCRKDKARLSAALDYLLEHADDEHAPTLAIQSVVMSHSFPGLEHENSLPQGYVPAGVPPRLWIGGRATVAAHYDPSENIACCVAGSRHFTLFPPAQVANLYVGPFELTPAGATISMVDFDQPDLERYPHFEEALDAAYEAVLEPGDAIYVPYMWWHHVRSREAVNALVNYWWSRVPERAGDPRNVLLHAMLAIRALPPSYRDAWRAMFEHYVFGDPDEAGAHLPRARRGILGEPTEDDIRRMRTALARALSRN